MRNLLFLLCFLATTAHAADAVDRAIADLEQCTTVEDAVCQAAPGRIAVWGSEAVPRLMKVFAELPAAGQILAVGALGRIDEPAATQALVQLGGAKSSSVRAVVLETLGGRSGAQVEKVLIAGLTAKEPTVRAAAAESLGKSNSLRDLKRVIPALARVCADTSEQVAVSAVESLGLIGDPRAVPSLLGALRSPRSSVRRAALFSARMIRDPRVISPLIELLLDVDASTVADAAHALSHLTQRQFGADYKVWKNWWVEVGGKLPEGPEP